VEDLTELKADSLFVKVGLRHEWVHFEGEVRSSLKKVLRSQKRSNHYQRVGLRCWLKSAAKGA